MAKGCRPVLERKLRLAARRPGDAIVVTGSLGRPLQLHPGARHLLLISEGAYVAPLLFLANTALSDELNVALDEPGVGMRVLEVKADRSSLRQLHAAIKAAL